MNFGRAFDGVADLYAEVRPGYLPALFDDLVAMDALGPSKAVMEVGCGPGQATKDLAPRSGRLVAIDPGERLISNARRGISAENVSFTVSTFEEFDATPASFDLIASAQAWHWVDAEVGFTKAYCMLRPGGCLAIFGHVPMMVSEALLPAFRAAFDTYWPGAWGRPPPQSWYLPHGPVTSMVAATRLFMPAEHRAYSWTWTFDPELFGRYLRTDSSYHVLAEAPRFALFDALSTAIADQGGTYDAAWETHLYVARKA